MILKFNNLLASSVAGGITGLLFGKDAGSLMIIAVIVGCMIYNIALIIKEKSN